MYTVQVLCVSLKLTQKCQVHDHFLLPGTFEVESSLLVYLFLNSQELMFHANFLFSSHDGHIK